MTFSRRNTAMEAIAVTVPASFTPLHKIREWVQGRRDVKPDAFRMAVFKLHKWGIIERRGRGSSVEYRFNKDFRPCGRTCQPGTNNLERSVALGLAGNLQKA